MNNKITGIIYIIVALLVIIVKLGFPQFFEYLLWIIAIILLIFGVYLLVFKKY